MYKIYKSVRSDVPWEIYFNEGDNLPYAPIGSTAYNVDTGVMMINDGNGWIKKIGNSGSGVEIKNQDKTITENGTYTADEGFTGLGSVVVDVAASAGGQEIADAIIDRSITEIFSNATFVGSYAFYGCENLTTVNFPAVTTVNDYAFYGCENLTTVNFPAAITVSNYAFEFCSALTTVNFPAVITIKNNSFGKCYALTTVNFPAVTSIASKAFDLCNALTTVNLSAITYIGMSAFNKCNKLVTLNIRNEKLVCSLASTNAFTSTPIASGTGYIYVPTALIEQYKAETNWSTYATQFRALEDYTVDGTVTGELDESKI